MRKVLFILFLSSPACFSQSAEDSSACAQQRAAYWVYIRQAAYGMKDDCYNCAKQHYRTALKMMKKSKCFKTDQRMQKDYLRVKRELRHLKSRT